MRSRRRTVILPPSARDGKTVRLARTIGIPLRYFVAKMYHGPFLVVADRMDRIFAWCQEQRIAWQFDPAYTRMVPAHYLVELDQVGCPDPSPRYQRFFDPPVGRGSTDLHDAGSAYITAAYGGEGLDRPRPGGRADRGGVFRRHRQHGDAAAGAAGVRGARPPSGSASGRSRSTSAAARRRAGRACGASLGLESSWERVERQPRRDPISRLPFASSRTISRSTSSARQPRCVCSEEIRRALPDLQYLIDGDGGDENLKSYPLEDSDLTLSSVLRNPLLYQEGWGVDAIKHSLAFSGGLSRSYVRTYAPAATLGFPGVLAVHRPIGDRVSRRDPVRAGARGRRGAAEHAQAARSSAPASGRSGDRNASQPEAALSGWRRRHTARARLQSLVPADLQPPGRIDSGEADSRDRRSGNESVCAVIQDAECRIQKPCIAFDHLRSSISSPIGPSDPVDPHRPYASMWEEERDESRRACLQPSSD